MAGNQTNAQLKKNIFRSNAAFIFFNDFSCGTQAVRAEGTTEY
jgi:hypothetical protein